MRFVFFHEFVLAETNFCFVAPKENDKIYTSYNLFFNTLQLYLKNERWNLLVKKDIQVKRNIF